MFQDMLPATVWTPSSTKRSTPSLPAAEPKRWTPSLPEAKPVPPLAQSFSHGGQRRRQRGNISGMRTDLSSRSWVQATGMDGKGLADFVVPIDSHGRACLSQDRFLLVKAASRGMLGIRHFSTGFCGRSVTTSCSRMLELRRFLEVRDQEQTSRSSHDIITLDTQDHDESSFMQQLFQGPMVDWKVIDELTRALRRLPMTLLKRVANFLVCRLESYLVSERRSAATCQALLIAEKDRRAAARPEAPVAYLVCPMRLLVTMDADWLPQNGCRVGIDFLDCRPRGGPRPLLYMESLRCWTLSSSALQFGGCVLVLPMPLLQDVLRQITGHVLAEKSGHA